MSDLEKILAELRNEECPDLAHLGKEVGPNPIDPRSPDAAHLKYRLEQWELLAEKLPELIHLAEIQTKPSKDFCRAVKQRIFRIQDEAYHPTDPRDCDEALLNAERSVRCALDAIKALDDEQLEIIGDNWIVYMDEDYAEEEDDVVGNWIRTTLKLLTGFEVSTGSAPYETGKTSKRGPKKLRSDLELDSLIRDLWLIAHAHGGRFTNGPELDGRAKGTMKQALDLLAPLLPAGLVPKAGLSATRIHQLRPDKNSTK
jgi:hypothetical protein